MCIRDRVQGGCSEATSPDYPLFTSGTELLVFLRDYDGSGEKYHPITYYNTVLYLSLIHILRGLQKRFEKAYGKPVPRITPHVLRHTFCTNVQQAGLDVNSLQYLMGHSNASVTLDVYTPSSFDSVERAVIFVSLQKVAVLKMCIRDSSRISPSSPAARSSARSWV